MQALPASEQVILCYIAFLTPNVAGTSLQVYLSALKSLHILNGLRPDALSSPRVKLAVKGIYDNGLPPSQKFPITFHIMNHMFALLLPNFDSQVVWVGMTLAFFGCLRAGEITIPSKGPIDPISIVRMCDIAFSHPPSSPYATLVIRRTKTAPHGCQVVIGCSGHVVCAYCSLLAYLNKVGVQCTSGLTSPLLVLANGQASIRTCLCLTQSL